MGKKIFLAGIAALLGGLILGNVGAETLGAVVYLAGGAACAVGVLIGIGKVAVKARDWFYQKWADRELRRMKPKEKKPRRNVKIPGWAKVVIAMVALVVLALITGEGGFLALSVLVLLVAITRILVQKVREQFAVVRRMEQEMGVDWAVAEVKLIGGSTEFKRGGIKGAMIGGLLGGGIGAAVGAVTRNGKAVRKQRFAVKYINGRTGTEEHRVGSRRYNELMRYVRWEEI